jgi:hypothetical protein
MTNAFRKISLKTQPAFFQKRKECRLCFFLFKPQTERKTVQMQKRKGLFFKPNQNTDRYQRITGQGKLRKHMAAKKSVRNWEILMRNQKWIKVI